MLRCDGPMRPNESCAPDLVPGTRNSGCPDSVGAAYSISRGASIYESFLMEDECTSYR